MEQQSGAQISHEAIYTAIYVLPRGELRRELIACLRQDKRVAAANRKAASAAASSAT